MRRTPILVVAMILVVAACGSGDGGVPDAGQSAGSTPVDGGGQESPASTDTGTSGSTGTVVNPQPPGQATVSVDGVEITFTQQGPVPCSVGDGFSYSFFTDDSMATLAGGGRDAGEVGWGGSIDLTVTDPEPDPESGELVFVRYIVFLPEVDGSTLAFDGSSMSYNGPMLKQTPGSAPPGEDVGTGTVSVTCP